MQNYMTDKYYPKIVKAVDDELKSQNFVAPIRVFLSMGLLEAQDIDNWRKDRVPYLVVPERNFRWKNSATI